MRRTYNKPLSDKHLHDEFSFEAFQMILENDERFGIDGTAFYFDDEPEKTYYICCDHYYNKPYRITLWDAEVSDKYQTASELLYADVFNGRSLKDRYEHIVIEEIDGVPLEHFALSYYKEIGKMLSERREYIYKKESPSDRAFHYLSGDLESLSS